MILQPEAVVGRLASHTTSLFEIRSKRSCATKDIMINPKKPDHMLSKNYGIIPGVWSVGMRSKCKRYSAEFKFKVALDAAKGAKTIN